MKLTRISLFVAVVITLIVYYFFTSFSPLVPLHEVTICPSCTSCPSPYVVVVEQLAVEKSVDSSGPNPQILPIFQGPSLTEDVIVSKLANQMDFETDWFKKTFEELRLPHGIVYHRKLWELTYIVFIVNKLGLCKTGTRGLVWAAGRERLISLFAGKGCEIMATDMDAAGAYEKGWAATEQHAATKDALFFPEFLKKDDFDRLVSYRTQNMNVIPLDTRNTYDFMWSTCSMEHVGSIPLGQRFVMNAMDLLKPGGVAIHTVEFTLSSDFKTLTSGDTVFWRKQDVESLALSLKVLGFEVYPINYSAGDGKLDKEVDLPPYKHDGHMKLQFAEHVVTSFAIVVKKPVSWSSGVQKEQTECA